jgi:hypothetical protein
MQWRPFVPALFDRSARIVGAGLVTATLLATTSVPVGAGGGEMSPGVSKVPHSTSVFRADPRYSVKDYDPKQQIDIYGGKKNIEEPRPLVELFELFYKEGPLQPNRADIFGKKNLFAPMFTLYGDWRTALAYNDNGPGKRVGQIATRLNLEADLQLTATERVHALFRPLDRAGQFTRAEFFGPDAKGVNIELSILPRTLFFEGDIGNIVAGFTDRYQTYDLPFAVGLIPLIMQNGIWVNDAIVGGAFSIAGRNSPFFGISNFDLTFFAGFDQVSTPAIKDAAGNFIQHDISVYGAATFIEANEGYWEAGIGYIHDQRNLLDDLSFANATVAFTKRYGGWLSNSVRGIVTFGQNTLANGTKTADGFVILIENSLISHKELVLVPYLNMFAGFNRPQALIRDAGTGGVLANTGILFQTDGLTGFPKLDDTAHDTYGAALGVNYLFDLEQQIVVEAATVQVINGDNVATRPAKGAQYGVGARYQRNLSRAHIFRADVMFALRENDSNIAGIRTEFRQKF